MKSHLDIFCLDDDRDILDLMKVSLGLQGHSVSTAMNLGDGYSLLEQKKYDLFILDLGIPDGDGLVFCQTIRFRHAHTPIIIYTGSVSDEEKRLGYQAGATMYISKPNGMDTIEKIANAIRNSSAVDKAAVASD
ncbi:MAG TPA: response regulator [Blastocatellia bacterium]|nr:response regulator [Blastocatellia bacterium]